MSALLAVVGGLGRHEVVSVVAVLGRMLDGEALVEYGAMDGRPVGHRDHRVVCQIERAARGRDVRRLWLRWRAPFARESLLGQLVALLVITDHLINKIYIDIIYGINL